MSHLKLNGLFTFWMYAKYDANTYGIGQELDEIRERKGTKINWGFANVMTIRAAAYANMCNGNSI